VKAGRLNVERRKLMALGIRTFNHYAILETRNGVHVTTYPNMAAIAEAALFEARREFGEATNQYVAWLNTLVDKTLHQQEMPTHRPAKIKIQYKTVKTRRGDVRDMPTNISDMRQYIYTYCLRNQLTQSPVEFTSYPQTPQTNTNAKDTQS